MTLRAVGADFMPRAVAMPHSDELERAVLGTCLMWPEALLELDVTEADFHSDAHRRIWRALCWLQAEGEPVDQVRVRERLESTGEADRAGGFDYLLGLTDVNTTRHPPTRRLKELTRLRSLHAEHGKLALALERGDLEGCTALASGLQVLCEDTGSAEAEVITAWDCAESAFEVLAGRSQRVLEVHPGLPEMREMLGDLEIGSVTFLGADTNVGKSSILLEMLLGAAERTVVAGYISREDLRVLIGRRFLAMLSGVPAHRIKRKEVSREEWQRLTHAAQALQNLSPRLLVNQHRGGTELGVCAAMTRMAQRGAKLIGVDYAQAIELSGGAVDRRNELARVCKRIGSHAERVGVAVVIASQLTVPQGAEGKEPGKWALKESRDLANMADNIVLAWREQESEFAPIRLKVAKGKDGGVGNKWAMQRDKETGRLREVV